MPNRVNALPRPFFFFFIFLIFLCGLAHGRFFLGNQSSPQDVAVISDGVHVGPHNSTAPHLALKILNGSLSAEADGACEETYGFLPCTRSVLGNLFLILVYGYLMYLAATYLSNGSELLLEILGPGIVGGLFLPILGSLPDAILILVSGLSGSTETAQSQVSVGMGLLAGSTVLILTLIWGSCVAVGKCDIQNSVAIDNKDTKGFSLTGSGVSTDIWTSYAARIMVISVIPFIIVQLPQLLNSNLGKDIAVLVSLIVSVALFLSYCLYQVFQPWIQRRRIAYAKHKHVISGILQHLKTRALGSLLKGDGEPNEEIIKKLFHAMDQDGDGSISYSELRAMIVGIRFDEIQLDRDDAVDKVMKEFDTSCDSRIDLQEFLTGISKWIHEAKRSGDDASNNDPHTMKFLFDFHSRTKQEHDLLGAGGQSDEIIEGVESPKWTTFKAVLMLLVGTLIAAAFADPLIDVVDNFSSATSIPTFFISFVALPLATSCEAVSAIMFASRKKIRTASLTFSQLYGSATMNNVLCLSVFLALVYFRGLEWDFSAEVLVILVVCIVMGVFSSFRTVFPLWTSSIAFLLYPFSVLVFLVWPTTLPSNVCNYNEGKICGAHNKEDRTKHNQILPQSTTCKSLLATLSAACLCHPSSTNQNKLQHNSKKTPRSQGTQEVNNHWYLAS